MTITEKTVQVYNLRFEQGFWANITLDARLAFAELKELRSCGAASYDEHYRYEFLRVLQYPSRDNSRLKIIINYFLEIKFVGISCTLINFVKILQ